MFFGTILILKSGEKEIQRKGKEIESRVNDTPDFIPTSIVKSEYNWYYFAVDDQHQKVLSYDPKYDRNEVVSYKDLIEVQILENNTPVEQKCSALGAAGRAIVGAGIAGTAGAIVGGLSGKTTTVSEVNIKVKILVRDQTFPSIIINCFDGTTEAPILSKCKEDAHKIFDLCSVIIDRCEKAGRKATKHTENDDMIKKLEKLGELRNNGILTEDEFNQEKKKILNT